MAELRKILMAISVTAALAFLLFSTIDNMHRAARPSRTVPDAPWITPELASVPR